MTNPEQVLNDAVEVVFNRLQDRGYASMNDAQRNILCVWSACGEVDNGGFEQYYFNDSGDWAVDTPQAFEAVGAPDLARIVSTANALFPAGCPSRSAAMRQQELEALSPSALRKLEKLSAEFDSTIIDPLLTNYVQQHALDLFASPA